MVYSGAGAGAAVLSVVLDKLIAKIGLENSLRLMGCMAWAICLPAAALLRSPQPQKSAKGKVKW